MTLKELSTLEWHIQCQRTSMPPDYVPRKKFTDKTANGLTKCIITFLRCMGNQAERISNMGRPVVSRGSVSWIPGSGTKGTADVSATIRGKSVKIEVKIGADRQSEAQKRYEADVKAAGGHYFIAKTWDDFYKQYVVIVNT